MSFLDKIFGRKTDDWSPSIKDWVPKYQGYVDIVNTLIKDTKYGPILRGQFVLTKPCGRIVFEWEDGNKDYMPGRMLDFDSDVVKFFLKEILKARDPVRGKLTEIMKAVMRLFPRYGFEL